MSLDEQAITNDDLQLVKEYTLLPILLDMLTRDMNEMKAFEDRIIYNHVIHYLQDIEGTIYRVIQEIKQKMRQRGIKILSTTPGKSGIDVEYKIRGYVHHFSMLRSLVKAELMTTLSDLRSRL
ncbi:MULTISPECIES: hypothetical protein [unclassified Paenibacillus]|uniref:hypothetical protein n=1 Tax=unclassified Paenibacillus TaxID=185978 RepID=UPI002783AA3F|nr:MULTISPECIES: hypothetical protein [unclassified Paenibacillus]MDQ0896284.1 hypothetical protein [Paenibacillus sp. V4I7]MDQ0913788.1 hypothetical protein [Paenibacillus sp. V4I5]